MTGGSKVRDWMRKRMMPRRKAAGSGSGSGGSGAPEPPARSKPRARAFSSALRRLPRVDVLAVLYEKVVYHLLWLVESVVVVARLCFFLMRFGFKL